MGFNKNLFFLLYMVISFVEFLLNNDYGLLKQGFQCIFDLHFIKIKTMFWNLIKKGQQINNRGGGGVKRKENVLY